jgi:hypothetical protein
MAWLRSTGDEFRIAMESVKREDLGEVEPPMHASDGAFVPVEPGQNRPKLPHDKTKALPFQPWHSSGKGVVRSRLTALGEESNDCRKAASTTDAGISFAYLLCSFMLPCP